VQFTFGFLHAATSAKAETGKTKIDGNTRNNIFLKFIKII